MPIATDSAKISIDFEYIWETNNEEQVAYAMRFQHSEYGAVILIYNGGSEPIELPASMFGEVAEFLVRQNAMQGIKSPITIGKHVPLPSISKKQKEESSMPIRLGQRVVKNESPIEPISSFSPNNTQDEVDENTVEDEQKETNENTVDNIAERMALRSKSNIEKKKINKVK